MDKPIFYEGQEVGCLISGDGVVLEIKESMVSVRFKDGLDTYFSNGAWLEHQRPTLYPIEQYRAIIKTLPAPQPEAWQPKPGEWCWFWENKWQKRALVLAKFIELNGGAYRAKVSNGSWAYDNCAPFIGELPEHLKEVKQ